MVGQLCYRAGNLLCRIRSDQTDDAISYWCDQLPCEADGIGTSMEGDKVVGHVFSYHIDQPIEESAIKLRDLAIEQRAESAGKRAAVIAERQPEDVTLGPATIAAAKAMQAHQSPVKGEAVKPISSNGRGDSDGSHVLRFDGESCEIRFESENFRMTILKGHHYLRELFQSPNKPISPAELRRRRSGVDVPLRAPVTPTKTQTSWPQSDQIC